MAYTDTTDLLLGDIPLGAAVDPQTWVDRAAEEIDSYLGTKYVLPLPDPPVLARHSELLLKRINSQLATGRLVMAIDAGNDNDLHAYGRELVRTALSDLNRIMNGSIELDGADVIVIAESRGPSIVNQDANSATAAFEDFAMSGQGWPGRTTYWRPGAG